jgi:hypothetical protein
VNWARTVRFDEIMNDVTQRAMSASLPGGSSLQFGEPYAPGGRTYGLVQGPASVEPADIARALAGARWYEETIVAIAIEPTPKEALPAIAGAFSANAGVSGVVDCTVGADSMIVEFQPSRTTPSLIVHLADVELRRFHGYRKVTLLNPLTAEVLAKIAASGLQAAEVAPDRILETLLEQSGVE